MPVLATDEWFWEGNVVDTVCIYLQKEGWQVFSRADTLSKKQGVDIHCKRTGDTLLIEVKGYPSTRFRDPRRAAEQKRTKPTVQAKHWYAAAILSAIRLQSKHPDACIALAFPDYPRYRALIADTQPALVKLDISVFLVSEAGEVENLEFK